MSDPPEPSGQVAARVALSYLLRREGLNRVRRAVRQLRSPRYVLGAVLALGYFGGLLWFLVGDTDGESAAMFNAATPLAGPVLAILVVAAWIGSKSHSSLALGPAESQWLLQAPLTRATLVQYRIVRSQPGIIFTATIMALFLRNLATLSFILVAVSVWILISTLYLHQVAASLVRTRWVQRGQEGRRRPWLSVGLFMTWVGAFVIGFARLPGLLREAGSMGRAMLAVETVQAHPAAAIALLPIELVVSPLFADSFLLWLWLTSGAAGLLILHYFWVVQTDAAFEEGAAAAGEEAAALLNAVKQGRSLTYLLSRRKSLPAPWFRLGPSGHPAVSIFWKNLTAFTRQVRPAYVAVLVGLFFCIYALLAFSEGTDGAGMATAGMLGILTLVSLAMGPLATRNDLRSDLQRLESLRTYPLSGQAVSMAGLAASTLTLTLTQASLLLLALVFVVIDSPPLPYSWLPAAAYVAAAVSLIPLNALALAIQNLLAVLFPNWYQLGPQLEQGIGALGGQVGLIIIGSLTTAIGLLAPVCLALGVGFVLWPAMGIGAVAPAFVSAWTVLGAELVVAVALIGRAYEVLDPVEAGLLR